MVANSVAIRRHHRLPIADQRVRDFARLTVEWDGKVVDAVIVRNHRGRRIVANLDLDVGGEANEYVERDVVGRGGGRRDLSLIRGVSGRATRGAGAGWVGLVRPDNLGLRNLRQRGVSRLVGSNVIGKQLSPGIVRVVRHIALSAGRNTVGTHGSNVVTLAKVVPGQNLDKVRVDLEGLFPAVVP